MVEEQKGHLFEGEPDARQVGDIVPTRFRPRYRKLTLGEMTIHDQLKMTAEVLERSINACAPSGEFAQHGTPEAERARYKSLAITNLEQAVMWAVKALTT